MLIGILTGIIKTEDLLKVETEKVERRSITETVSASGKIQPEVEVKISSDISGEIVELLVKEGDISIKQSNLFENVYIKQNK